MARTIFMLSKISQGQRAKNGLASLSIGSWKPWSPRSWKEDGSFQRVQNSWEGSWRRTEQRIKSWVSRKKTGYGVQLQSKIKMILSTLKNEVCNVFTEKEWPVYRDGHAWPDLNMTQWTGPGPLGEAEAGGSQFKPAWASLWDRISN